MVIRRRCNHVDSSILAADCIPAEDDSAVCQALTMRRPVRIATPAIVHRISASTSTPCSSQRQCCSWRITKAPFSNSRSRLMILTQKQVSSCCCSRWDHWYLLQLQQKSTSDLHRGRSWYLQTSPHPPGPLTIRQQLDQIALKTGS